MKPVSLQVLTKSILFASAACACLVLSGCGGTSLGTVPVQGTVTIDGNPVEGVTIVFNPDDAGGRAASGRTDASGNYTLTTEINGDGALPGGYKITVSKVEVEEDDTLPEQVDPNDEGSMDAIYGQLDTSKEQKSKNLVAKKFGNATTSGLAATVAEEGENKFDFEVTSK